MLDFVLQVVSNPIFWGSIGGGLAFYWMRPA